MRSPTPAVRADTHLRRAPWFDALNPVQQEQVLATSRLRVVPKGTLLAHHGEVPCNWLGVVHGALKASTFAADGRISARLLVTTAEWADGEELVQGVARRHDVVAIRDTVVVLLPAPVFRELLARSADFCRFVLMQVSRQHAQQLTRIENARTMSKVNLVAQTVFELATQLDGAQNGFVALKQEDIAEFTGISRQTVNQALKALEGRGLLRTLYGRVEVRDLAALSDYARPELLSA